MAGHNRGVHGAVLADGLSPGSPRRSGLTDHDLTDQLKIDSRAVRDARNLPARLDSGEIGGHRNCGS